MMVKTKRELAFIRDFHLSGEFTEKFTELVDEHLTLPTKGKLLYVETGTGNHILDLSKKSAEKLELFAVEADAENLQIAKAKAVALKSKIDFRQSAPHKIEFGDEQFNLVIGDVSFIPHDNLPSVLDELVRVAETDAKVAFFLPTAGSYGEFFSVFWETLFNEDLAEHGENVENLIKNQTTVSQAEEMAEDAGLKDIEIWTNVLSFDYKDGAEFLSSTLIQDFLLPQWLEKLPSEVREKVSTKLAQNIDAERDDLSFRLSLKATLIVGTKE